MRAKLVILGLVGIFLSTTPAFASGVNINFGGVDGTLGTSAAYGSGGLTVTASGYICDAATPSSTNTLSNCAATALYQKNDSLAENGLGLAGQGGGQNEIGWDGPSADYVIGLDVSNLFNLGVTSIKLSFGSVQPGEAYAILGYASDPFLNSSFALTNTKAFVGNDGSTSAQVFSSTIGLNANDEFLVLVSPCGASLKPPPCGSNVLLDSLTAPTPEPGTLLLMGSGLLLLGFGVRRIA